jgi:hypothetical protein
MTPEVYRSEHAGVLLIADEESVRVIADGVILWRARCVAPHEYEVHPGELRPRCTPYTRQRQALVSEYIAAAWRRVRPDVLGTAGPTGGHVRQAWRSATN